MKRTCNWIIIFLLMSGNCVAQKRAARNISTNTMIERTVLTMSDKQKAEQDSIARAQEQLNTLNLLRAKEEQEAQQLKLEEERAKQQEDIRQQKEAQQAKEDIARNADLYYIAWLLKTQHFDPAYRKEVQTQYDVSTIMHLINEYTPQELLKKAQGHHSNLLIYKK